MGEADFQGVVFAFWVVWGCFIWFVASSEISESVALGEGLAWVAWMQAVRPWDIARDSRAVASREDFCLRSQPIAVAPSTHTKSLGLELYC